jgi:hypothetical protein
LRGSDEALAPGDRGRRPGLGGPAARAHGISRPLTPDRCVCRAARSLDVPRPVKCYHRYMSNARAPASVHPAVAAARAAPNGPPLSEDERARVEAMRKAKPEDLIPHAEISRQLEERKRRGE